jgi:hypothetical protein
MSMKNSIDTFGDRTRDLAETFSMYINNIELNKCVMIDRHVAPYEFLAFMRNIE